MERVYHTWEKWECYPAGFYGSRPPKGMTADDCEAAYAELLSDEGSFRDACAGVVVNWPNSCEHYLTNEKMNRIAWMGQAALAYARGIPACYRGGYNRLTDEQQRIADLIALYYINEWMRSNGHPTYTISSITSKTAANIY